MQPTPTRSAPRGRQGVPPALLLVLAATAPLPAQTGPQTGVWDPGFTSPGLGGRVFALAEFQGELIAGGYVFRTDRPIQNVARFDGRSWQPLGQGLGGLGTTTAQRHVRALAVYNGELIAAGAFTTADGLPANSIARWDGARWAPLGAGVQGDNNAFATVHALAVHSGELWVGGDFTVAGGQPIAALARWNGTVWQPAGTFAPDLLGNLAVFALRSAGTDLYAGGEFSQPGANVARFDGAGWSALGAGTDSAVRTLVVHGGEVVAGGAFLSAGGVAAAGVAAWNGSTWRALGRITPGTSVRVFAAATSGSDLYVTGRFGDLGRDILHVARWDGTSWQGIGGIQGVVSGSLLTTGLCLLPRAADLVLGGEFEYAGTGLPAGPGAASRNVVAFDGRDWLPIGAGGHGCNAPVLQIVRYGAGFVAVGDFETTGTALTRGLAFFDGDGFAELGRFEGGPVEQAVEFAGELYVTGRFTSVEGQPIARAARYDGSRWHSWGNGSSGVLAVFGGRLHQGAADGLWVWNGTARTLLGRVAGEIDHLHVHQGALYVSAWNAFQPAIHRWDGTALVQVATTDAQVEVLGSFGTELVAGGAFASIGGAAATRIARYDGSSWRAFGAGLGNGIPGTSVHAVAELDGVLYAGGNVLDGIRAWDGSAWQPLAGGIPAAVHAILADPADGSLWIGGDFLAAGSIVADNLARWQTAPAWRDVLHGTAGAGGIPLLAGRGSMQAGSPFSLALSGAPASAPAALVGSALRVDLPLVGGLLVPAPDFAMLVFADPSGGFQVGGVVPAGLVPLDVWFQVLALDGGAPGGVAFSNALRAALP